MDEIQKSQLTQALTQAALIEAKELSIRFAEIIAYLQKQQHLPALGAFSGLEDQFKFIESLLKAASKINQK